MWSHLNLWIALLVFSTAAVHEVFCVAFIYYAERNKAFMTGISAILAGQCSVTAWIFSIDEKQYVPFMLIGWCLGAMIGVKWRIGGKK